jgi:hypothetical protein
MLLITLLTIKLTEVFDIIPGVQVKPKVNLSNGGIYQLLAPSNIPFDFAESLKGEFVKCALSIGLNLMFSKSDASFISL